MPIATQTRQGYTAPQQQRTGGYTGERGSYSQRPKQQTTRTAETPQQSRTQTESPRSAQPATYEGPTYNKTAPSGPPPRTNIPDNRPAYYGGDDPYQQMENNRRRAVAQGDMMNQDLQDFRNV